LALLEAIKYLSAVDNNDELVDVDFWDTDNDWELSIGLLLVVEASTKAPSAEEIALIFLIGTEAGFTVLIPRIRTLTTLSESRLGVAGI